MKKKLTQIQLFKYYRLSIYLGLISIIIIYPFGLHDFNLAMFLFPAAAIVNFFIKKSQLKFVEYNISCTIEDFQKTINVTAEQLEWDIKKISDNHFIGYQHLVLSTHLIITLKRKADKIFINCIYDPDFWSNDYAFGWLRKNASHFIANLEKIQSNIPIVEEPLKKWNVFDYLIRIIAYPTCIFMIVFMFYSLIKLENVIFGLLVGLMGFMILRNDIISIKNRIMPKR